MENRIKTAPVFSKRLRAGRRRTYFFDVRTTRSNDYFLTITESKKRQDESYERHKILLYKEDFNKFIEALGEAVNEIKTKYLPEYDFDEFEQRGNDHSPGNAGSRETPHESPREEAPSEQPPRMSDDEVERWD